ncbi:L-arabinose isomerase [Paenibacillus gorillae]|uniref:L-arabinose isomerase n=1 Tax=Paenibacillus gorillae TaxID=1243662 RepID=UPI0004B417DA|nr:L-arabinose isomerase [Paenibacillus gorillae]
MPTTRAYQFWFVTGSQHLYGPETLEQVNAHSSAIAAGMNDDASIPFEIVFKPVVTTPDEIARILSEANTDVRCAGIIAWMHTFSPAKMWIGGLTRLQKPLLHLATQFNRDIPWQSIDMDFMNLNQAAHGDREFGFVNTRLRLPRKVIFGYWQSVEVRSRISDWMTTAIACLECRSLKVARFGDNMRAVAVTEGDKVEALIKLGWTVDGFGIGDLVARMERIADEEIDSLMATYEQQYEIPSLADAAVRDSIRYQARIELGLKAFLEEGGYGAFTTTFEDLHGMKQLPGLAVQRLMAQGYGFGGEGDWKTAALLRVMKIMSGNVGTSFMEDYTYHLDPDNELVLGAHMLEVCPTIADTEASKPAIQVHPLGIGGKDAPARLVFNGRAGRAINASIIDLGNRFRLLVNEVEAVSVEAEQAMPLLPVARVLWRVQPSMKDGIESWILAGGAHHTVFSYSVTTEQLADFAEWMGIELVVIDQNTAAPALRQQLRLSDAVWRLM